MDLRQIKTGPEDFGLMTYDPAFMNTASCQSAITYLTATKESCAIAAIRLSNWRSTAPFLEVAYLLLHGELPTEEQLEYWELRNHARTTTHVNVKKFMEGFHHDAHPMGVLIRRWRRSPLLSGCAEHRGPKCRRKQIVR